MYPRGVMVEKLSKVSFFSVITKISTYGDALKLRASTFLRHLLDVKDHEDYKYTFQIAIWDVNKGHIVDFPKFSTVKNDIFSTKKIIKKFSMFLRNSLRWQIEACDPLHLKILFDLS